MASLWLYLVLIPSFYYCHSQISALRHNLKAAKKSGLPYKVVLGDVLSPIALLPFIDWIPRSWIEGWLPLVIFPRTWHAGYEPFAKTGADTFIAVSMSRNSLWTCDPEAVLQISRSKDGFPKATESLAVLNIYGPTVTGTDGDESRTYRKVTHPSFNERTHAAVWTETLRQTATLLKVWAGGGDKSIVDNLGRDVARVTLHIMSRVCFGQQMDWKHELGETTHPPQGHKMTYGEALSSTLDNIMTIFGVPHAILKVSPITSHRLAWTAFSEWRLYMQEMLLSKRIELNSSSGPHEHPNLLEALVRAGPQDMSSDKGTQPDATSVLSTPAQLGNMFIFLLAGHETSASTLQFAITCLACHPQHQRRLQRSLDAVLQNRPPSTWTYRSDFPTLYRRFPGAVIAETVRLFTVLPFYLRCTEPNSTQTLTLNGHTHLLPPDMLVLINTSAAHRHPIHWPRTHPPETDEERPCALSDFDPCRWLAPDPKAGHTTLDTNMNTVYDDDSLSEKVHTPFPGSYVPFSTGTRGCMGSRFAELELIAMLALIFSEWSVELVEDTNRSRDRNPEGHDDDDETKEKKRQDAWTAARQKARSKVNERVGFGMALKMTEEVSVRFVRRVK